MVSPESPSADFGQLRPAWDIRKRLEHNLISNINICMWKTANRRVRNCLEISCHRLLPTLKLGLRDYF